MELQRPRKPATKIVKERDEEIDQTPVIIENTAKKTKNNTAEVPKQPKIEEKVVEVVPLKVEVPVVELAKQPELAPVEDHSEKKGGIFELMRDQHLQPMEDVPQIIYPKLEMPLPAAPPLEMSKLHMAYPDARTTAIESLRLPHELKEKLTSVVLELEPSFPEPMDSHFYRMVQHYKNEVDNLSQTRQKIKKEDTECGKHYTKIWTVEDVTKTLSLFCNDRKQLKENFTWKQATLNEQVFKDFQAASLRYKDQIYQHFVTHIYQVQSSSLEISTFVEEFLSQAPFRAVGNIHPPPEQINERIQMMLHYIDVLFYFEKTAAVAYKFSEFEEGANNIDQDHADFLTNIKLWLRNFISAGIFFLNGDQRKYLVNQMIRCPQIAQWGANFFYFPEHFDQLEHAQYFVDMLCIVLKPYVKSVGTSPNLRSELTSSQFPDWTDVEKVQKDYVLLEDDLDALLDQFPFGAFMTCVFTRSPFGFDYMNYAVEIIASGIKTFGSYTSFVKRLCKLLVDMLHAVTAIVFRGKQNMGETMEQFKFDYIFEKVLKVLKRNPKYGTMHYLPILPYEYCSRDMHWKLLAGLYTFYDANDENFFVVTSADEWLHHIDSTNTLRPTFHRALYPHNDAPFLLQAFGSVALYWGQQIAVTVLHEIFYLGFVQKEPNEAFQKNSRDVLAMVLEKYPELISVLLTLVSQNFAQVANYVSYLYASIPLHLWKPIPDTDVPILRSWLMSQLDSPQQKLVRSILGRLTWGLDRKNEQELFIGDEFHQKIAFALFEVYLFHRAAYNQLSVFSMWKKTYLEFFEWSWRIIQKTQHFYNGAPRLGDLQSDVFLLFDQTRKGKDAAILLEGTEALALFELTPLRNNMFHQNAEFWLLQLMNQKNNECQLRLLFDLVPNLARQQISIENKGLFIKMMQNLLVDEPQPGLFAYYFQNQQQTASVPKLLASMIMNHLTNGPFVEDTKIGGTNINLPLFAFWFSGLLCMENWYTTKNACLILNAMLSSSFGFKIDVLKQIQNTLAGFLPRETPEQASGYFGAVTSYFLGPAKPAPKDEMIVSAEYPWLAFETLYIQTLMTAERRKNVGVEKFGPGDVYFKWMKLCLDMDPAHPVITSCWQIFCVLTLENASHVFSPFRTLQKETQWLEKVLVRLEFLYKHFMNLNERTKEPAHNECGHLFRAMIRWIKEGRQPEIEDKILNEFLKAKFMSLQLTSLKWENRDFFWMELVPLREIETQIVSIARLWKDIYHFPAAEDKFVSSLPKAERTWFPSFLEDKQVQQPPPFVPPQLQIVPYSIENLDKFRLQIEDELLVLLKATKSFLDQMNTHATLELKFCDLIPQLWQSLPKTLQRVQSCSRQCTGAAVFSLQVSESSDNREIGNGLVRISKDIKAIVANMDHLVPPSLVSSYLRTKKSLQVLAENRTSNSKAPPLGVLLFHQLSEIYSSENCQYSPLRSFIAECIAPLKQIVLNSPSEPQQILQRMLQDTCRIPLLTPFFNPNILPEKAIGLYTTLVYGQMRVPEVGVLVPVAQRFDIQSWLLTKPDVRAGQDALKLFHSAISGVLEKNPGIFPVEDVLAGIVGMAETTPVKSPAYRLLELHLQFCYQVLMHEYPTHLNYIIRLALVSGLSSPVWKVILTSPIEDHVTAETVSELEKTLSAHFWKERSEVEAKKLSLYSNAGNGVNCFGHLLMRISKSKNLLPKSIFISLDVPVVLEFLISVVEPWFSPFNPVSHSTTTPWVNGEGSVAQQLLSTVIHIFEFLQQFFPEQCVSHLWGVFVTCFAMHSQYFTVQEQKNIANQFLEFGLWNQLKISPLVLQQCVELLKGLDDTTAFFAASSEMLSKAQWDFTQAKASSQNAVFMFQFGLLLAQKSKPVEERVDIFQKLCADFDWSSLTSQHLTACLATQDLFRKLFQQLALLKQKWLSQKQQEPSYETDSMLSRILTLLYSVTGVAQLKSMGPSNPNVQALIPSSIAKLKQIIVFVNEICKNFVGVNQAVAETLNYIFETCEGLELESQQRISLFQMFLNVLNYNHIDLNVMLEPLGKHYKCACDMLSAGGFSIANIPKLCVFSEFCLEVHFEHSSSWEDALEALKVPQIDEQLFIKTCIQQACILTLCAHGFQLNSKKLEESGLNLPVVDTILKWSQEMDVYKFNQKEHKMVTFWLLVADLLWQDIRFSNSKERISQLLSFANSLNKFGEDKKSEGFLGMLGFGEKSPFSVKFRICCKLVSLFLLSQARENGQFRMSPKDPFVLNKNIEKQIIILMDQCKTDKAYSPFGPSVNFITSTALLQNPNKTLDNLSSFVFELACRFYPEHEQIFVKFLKQTM